MLPAGRWPSLPGISLSIVHHLTTSEIMNNSFVKRTDYTVRPVGELNVPAGIVLINLYANTTVFANIPVSQTDFETYINDYTAKYSAYVDGGSAAKGEFNMAEETLLRTMNSNALYVDSIARGDRNIILLSGFVPTKETATPKQKPAMLTGLVLQRGSTGELTATCDKQEGVESYIAVLTADNPPPAWFTVDGSGQVNFSDGDSDPDPAQPQSVSLTTDNPSGGILDFNKGRKKTFMGLTPGTTYWVTMFGINTAGVGPLCPPVSIVCY
jgi:hypothetical protein